MLKFVLIGILIIGALGFVMWNFWNMILLKHKHFSNSENCLYFVSDFKDVPKKLRMIKWAKIKNWLFAFVGTTLTILLILTYFIVTRNIFANNHTHSYKDSVIKNPTCIEQGILGYKCRYCDEKYEEPIAVIEHEYSESKHQEPTCIKEGIKEYTCKMCKDIKTETISVVAHEYIETKEKESTCTTEGVLTRECKNCDTVVKENIPTNDEHTFKTISFKSSSFWKNGYNHYSCEECGVEEYSLRVQNFNWIVILAIVILVVSIIIIAAIRSDEGFWKYTFEHPMFWVSLVLAILSATLMVFHWGVIRPHQENNKPIYQSVSGAPVDCELVEIKRTESNHTENGTVVYKCQKCQREYTEYLELKEIDTNNIPLYKEPTIAEKKEKENNNKIDKAAEIPLLTKVTGNLSSTKDVDFYKITLLADGDIKFNFTHEADEYSNHWYAAIYDLDKTTVLSEGYIEKDKNEFGHSGLPAGTYYLKISAISGGNPLLNIFSNANYHLMFTPVCTEHTDKSQYFSEIPSCSKAVEIKTVCNKCQTVVLVGTKELDHNWSEWKIIKPSSVFSLGEKVRICALCNQAEQGKDFTYWWVIPLIILELLLLVMCSVVLFKIPKKHMVYILSLLAISCIASVVILNNPVFDTKIWDGVALGIILALNTTPIVVFICFMIDSMARKRCYIYETTPITLSAIFAVMLILGFTAFSEYAITVVLVMVALAINAIAWSIIAHNDREKAWMVVNIIIALINIIFAIFFSLKI